MILTFVLSTGLTAVLISCCSDSKEYWVMTGMTTQFFDPFLQSTISDSTDIDSLNIQITAEQQYVSQNQPSFSSFFVSQIYALSCPNPGEQGLKHELVDVIITSDEDFNQFISGQNLSSICSINNKSVDYFINSEWHAFESPEITISQKPSQSVLRNFTMTFVFDNGSSVVSTTESIVWH